MYNNHYPPQRQPPPPRKRKRHTGLIATLSALGLFGVLVGGCTAMLASGGGDGDKPGTSIPSTTGVPTPSDTSTSDPTDTPTDTPTHKPHPHKVIFKVWGTGSVDATYGSDTDNIQGPSTPGWTRKVKLNDDAMYYAITAQLNGSGNVHCSVTIDGQTKKGHAVGAYNICSAQLNSDMFGGWS